jgi:mono/diheme cytochrome c family protein
VRRTDRSWLIVLLTAAALSPGCSGDDASLSPQALEGKRIYMNVCIACHNGNPNRDGSPGPAIAGSSRELLEAKVIRGEYPPGYTPKRPTATMPRFDYLADKIDPLAAYLAEASEASEPRPAS